MRLLPLFLLLAVIGCLLSPFLFTAWLREHYGVDITGTVTRKQETVWHSTFENDITRSAMVTVSYFPLGRSWPAYQTVTLPLERYDQVNRGDVLRMRYLLERDLPDYPLLHSLYRSGFLPVASVDGRNVFTIWRDLLPELPVRLLGGVTALILVLWLWYKWRIPGGVFATVICFLGALAVTSFWEIPHPMPPLQGAVLAGRATVQNEWTIDKVFVSRNSTNSWSLDRPVQYVSLEFVPEGRRESVVAADNIDAGSISNLQVGQSLAVQYERANPRNARLVAGTRTFWKKNLRGLAITAVIWIVFGGLAIVLWEGFSRRRPGSGRAATSAS
jgi:hypothetical protein